MAGRRGTLRYISSLDCSTVKPFKHPSVFGHPTAAPAPDWPPTQKNKPRPAMHPSPATRFPRDEHLAAQPFSHAMHFGKCSPSHRCCGVRRVDRVLLSHTRRLDNADVQSAWIAGWKSNHSCPRMGGCMYVGLLPSLPPLYVRPPAPPSVSPSRSCDVRAGGWRMVGPERVRPQRRGAGSSIEMLNWLAQLALLTRARYSDGLGQLESRSWSSPSSSSLPPPQFHLRLHRGASTSPSLLIPSARRTPEKKNLPRRGQLTNTGIRKALTVRLASKSCILAALAIFSWPWLLEEGGVR